MTKATIKFYPNLQKKHKKTQKVPMYLRIHLNGKKAETRIPIEISDTELSHWDEISQRFRNRDSKHNRYLNKFENEFEDLKFQVIKKLPHLSASDLINKMFGREGSKTHNVIQYLDFTFKNVIERDLAKAKGTRSNYEKAFNHFKAFLESVNKNLCFTDITLAVAEEFVEYLTGFDEVEQKVRMSKPTAKGYLRKIRYFFKEAKRKGVTDSNPFEGLFIQGQSPRKEKLTTIQVRSLHFADWNGYKQLEKISDLFLFSIYTGLAYEDAQQLSERNLHRTDEKTILLTGVRVKSKKEFKLYLVQQAIDIIAKYKKNPAVQEKGKLLPSVTNQEYNRWLKVIATKINVHFSLTTHTARHTFRVMLNEAKITDTAVRKTMMGHSQSSDIDSIYNEVTEQQLLHAKESYESFLTDLYKAE